MFFSAMNVIAAQRGHSGLYAGRSSCPPLLGVTRSRKGEYDRCAQFNDLVFAAIRSKPSIRNVIIVSRWGLFADGRRYKNEAGPPVFISDSNSKSIGFQENRAAFARGLRRTISRVTATGRTVTVIGPVPEVGWNVPTSLAMRKYLGVERPIAPRLKDFETRQAFVLRTMKSIGDEFSANLIFPHEILCATESCLVQQNAKPLYWDDDHLSIMGATMVVLRNHSIFNPGT
jgi:hypothetical protein